MPTAPTLRRASALSRGLARLILGMLGWTLKKPPALPRKFLAIAAPHTSNADFWYYLLLTSALGVPLSFMAKKALFKGPQGLLMRALGGIAIDRSKDTNVVEATIRAFQESEQLVIGILPEGTRSRTDHWKSGFYHIAVGAGVPLVLFYMDFSRREGGASAPLTLLGDMERDMNAIRAFYAGKKGIKPHNASEIRLKGET